MNTTEVETIPADPTVVKLRALMERKGWGQNETARYLGIPPGTLGNWMQGKKRPTRVVGRLIDVLAAVEMFAPHVYNGIIETKVKKAKSDEEN